MFISKKQRWGVTLRSPPCGGAAACAAGLVAAGLVGAVLGADASWGTGAAAAFGGGGGGAAAAAVFGGGGGAAAFGAGAEAAPASPIATIATFVPGVTVSPSLAKICYHRMKLTSTS